MSDLKFFPYKKGIVDRNQFQAKNDYLDSYIRQHMSQFEKNNYARNYIAVDKDGNFVSLLCLSASTIKSEDILSSGKKHPKQMDLPTVKIGRLVVDSRYRGRNFGEETLQEAIKIFVEVTNKIGVIGLTVDAKNESIGFYEKYSFVPLVKRSSKQIVPMILYLDTLTKILPALV